ncbi:MAG: hypothetical protein WC924_02860 [Candidatus Gracilibacteria bacterium]
MLIHIDKIASVTKNAGLESPVEITDDIKPESGAIIVVEVLEDKKIYNQLELCSGRLSTLQKGDIIVVALGNRKALKGFVGNTPKTLKPGDIITVLNLGGVAGICISENIKEVGHALKVKVLGAVAKDGKAINIADFKQFDFKNNLDSKIPLIVVSGTCMNVGKTTVASEVIKYMTRAGKTVFAAKLAGIACLRDTENMRDHGAKKIVSIIDAGLTSTVNTNSLSLKVTKGAIDHLSEVKPDYIVIEFGDGVYGEYGVMEILKDKEIQKNIVLHIGCAHDPMGAAKLFEVCKEIGAPLDMISGPVTDNEVGTGFVKNNLKIPAFNALTDPQKFADHLLHE